MKDQEQETPSAPTFGGLVRTFREQRGWTQQRLADHWGFTREYVSQIERGKRKLYGEQSVIRLAEILEIPLAFRRWASTSPTKPAWRVTRPRPTTR